MAWIGSNKNPEVVHLTDDQMDMLGELADSGNEYWESVQRFILQTKNRELSSLSDAQRDWYYTITASLDRELNFKEARVAFGEDSDQYKHERKRR